MPNNMERVLDWRPNWDQRSNKFLLSVTPMCARLRSNASSTRTKSVWLDQGQQGACTGFGLEHVRALSPYPQHTSDEMAQALYQEARRQDEWDGEDYEGSSVNGAMRAARLLGTISSWRWAKTTQEARHGLSFHGAGEVGTWWWSGMWDADEIGFIHPTGSREGGHAYAIGGFKTYPTGRRAYRIDNSWGKSWGHNGSAWIWEEDLASLLADDGELAFPTKVR